MDGKSFQKIYSGFCRRSFLFVNSYVHDEMVAEDIVSDSLIKMWEKQKMQGDFPVAPFLFTILKNKAIDHLKHEKIKQSAVADRYEYLKRDMDIRLSTLEASDPNEIFSLEISQIIQETLDLLPERTRIIFRMSRFEGCSYKDIAEKYGITVKGVDYHILHALNVLRINLKDYLPAMLFFLTDI